MQIDPLDNFEDSPYRKPHLFCTVCGKGEMVPAIEEGEPDYTDRFLCRACGHHATIPTIGIIVGQILTGAFGLLVCAYLLIVNFTDVLGGLGVGRALDRLQGVGALIIASMFLIGFMYISYQAISGIKIRRHYSRKPKGFDEETS